MLDLRRLSNGDENRKAVNIEKCENICQDPQ